MAIRKKIDSNETSAYYAEEESLGVLPATPDWKPLEPNEYDDFGGELTLLARNPINSSRQRKKGVITDLDASGGFQQDFTQTNMTDLLQGFMFADARRKLASEVDAVSGTAFEVADETGFTAGMIVYASGFETVTNNGAKVVTGTAAGEVLVAGLTAEAAPPAGAAITVVGIKGGAGDFDIDTTTGRPRLTVIGFDFEELGIIPGEWLHIGGDGAANKFTNAGNTGYARVYSMTDTTLIFDQTTQTMVTEADATQTVEIYFGTVIKNELGPLVKRRSYQLERQLGAPDTDNPTDIQSEYLVGAVPSEFVLNIAQADKLTADLSFVAINNEQRTATDGIKTGNRIALIESDAFNTSTDFADLRLYVVNTAVQNSTPLFGYLTDMSVTINNNVQPNKAVAVLGAFDVTAGTFEVSGEASAYFATIEAVQAVRSNEDVGLLSIVAKDNYGFIFDMPLIALGDARLDVSQDEPIKLPLEMNAATAVKLNAQTDYTLLWVFFDYLPVSAMPTI